MTGGGAEQTGIFSENGRVSVSTSSSKTISTSGAKGIGIPLEKLITHKYPLEEINEALVTNLKMEGLKIAIVNK